MIYLSTGCFSLLFFERKTAQIPEGVKRFGVIVQSSFKTPLSIVCWRSPRRAIMSHRTRNGHINRSLFYASVCMQQPITRGMRSCVYHDSRNPPKTRCQMLQLRQNLHPIYTSMMTRKPSSHCPISMSLHRVSIESTGLVCLTYQARSSRGSNGQIRPSANTPLTMHHHWHGGP